MSLSESMDYSSPMEKSQVESLAAVIAKFQREQHPRSLVETCVPIEVEGTVMKSKKLTVALVSVGLLLVLFMVLWATGMFAKKEKSQEIKNAQTPNEVGSI